MAGLHQERPLTWGWGGAGNGAETSSLEEAGMVAGSSQQSVHAAQAVHGLSLSIQT